MKRKIVFSLFVTLCAAFVSCNRGAELEGFDPNTERDVVLQATMEQDAATRAASLTQEGVAVSWAENDILDLVFENEVVSQLRVTAINGNTAQLAGKVKGAYPKNTEFSLYYGGTNYDYTGQTGTAASAASKAYLQGTVRISKQDNEILTLGSAVLKHQQAYVSFTFRYGPDELPIKSVTVTPASASIVKTRELGDNPVCFAGTSEDSFTVNAGSTGLSTVYFAISDMATTASTAYDFAIVAEWNGSDTTFLASNSKHFQNGKYYMNTEVVLKKKSDAIATLPAAVTGLMYDTQEHALITPAEMNEGAKIYYAVTDVIATDLPSETVWSEDVPEKTEPGSYMVWYKVEGGKFYEDMPASYDEATFVDVVIAKRPVAITKPKEILGLKYTGSAQALVNPGTVKDGVNESFDCGLQMEYYVYEGEEVPSILDNVTWTTDIPNGTNAGKYYIFYRVNGAPHYEDVNIPYDGSNYPYLTVTISKSDAVIANPVPIENLVYNGEPQQLVLPADASDGCAVYYFVTDNQDFVPTDTNMAADDWSLDVPFRKNAGTYYIWTKTVDESGANNYSGVIGISAGAVVTGIGQTSVSVVNAPEKVENWTYDGVNHDLVKAIEYAARPNRREVFAYAGPSGQRDPFDVTEEEYPATLQFRINTGEWVSINNTTPDYSVVAAKNAGTYSIQYRVVGSKNFKDYPGSGTGYVGMDSVVVAKASINVTVPDVIDDWTVYDNAEHTLLKDSPATAVTYAGANNTDALSATAEAPNPAVLYYRVNSGEWVAYNPENPNLPKATNAGTYQVWYKVEGGINFASKTATSIGSFTVAKVTPTITPAPAAKTDLVYNGEPQGLLAADNYSTNYGTLQFGVSMTNSVTGVTWGSELPTGQNAGTYYPFYRVVGNENISDLGPVSFIVTIARATLSSFAVDIEGWNYGDPANAPSVSGNTGGGAVTYSYKVQGADDNTYSGTAPTAPGDYTVRAIAAQTTNYESATATKNFTIGQATGTLTLSSSTVYLAAGGAPGAIYAISNDTAATFTTAIGDGTIASVAADPSDNTRLIITPIAVGETTITVSMTPSSTVNYTTPEPQVCSLAVVLAPVGAPENKPGIFSVSDNNLVFFSRGNLRATGTTESTPASGWTWSFAESQWDFLGYGSANQKVNGNGTISENGTVDLFRWSTTEGYYGIGTSTSGNVFRDWGENAISNGGNTANFWSTFTRAQIDWLIGSRPMNPVNGTSNARYAMAKINKTTLTDGTGVAGTILFPDNYAGPVADVSGSITWGDINTPSNYTTLCTSEGWSTLEQYGCVFLPSAGFSMNDTVYNVGSELQYWTKDQSTNQESYAYALEFANDPQYSYITTTVSKSLGNSVRLIVSIFATTDNTSLQDYTVQPGQTW